MSSDDIVARIRALTVEKGAFDINGRLCEYSVISKELHPDVPNFVGVLGENEFFISEEVPRRFRYPMIAHEVYCLMGKDMGHDGHCLAAVEFALRFVTESDRAEYLAIRRKFFSDLIEVSKGGDPVFLREITASRDYLCGIT
ncbi:MAG: hypothetical protein AAB927_03945 [Patescibacteria group bacterium]